MAQLAGPVARSLMMLNDNSNSPATDIDRPQFSKEINNHQNNQSNNNNNNSHHGVVQQAYLERKALLERSPSIAQLAGIPATSNEESNATNAIISDESKVGIDSTKSKTIMMRRRSSSSSSSTPFQQIQPNNNSCANTNSYNSTDSNATIKQQQHVINTLRSSHEKQATIIAQLQKQLNVANQTATAISDNRVNNGKNNNLIQSIKVHKPMRISTTNERSDDDGDDDERWHDAKSPPRHNSSNHNNMGLPAHITMPVSPTHLRRIKHNNNNHHQQQHNDNNTHDGFQEFEQNQKDLRIGSPPQHMTSSQQQRRRRQSMPWSMPPRSRESMLGEGVMGFGLGMSDSASNGGGGEGASDELLVECVECGKWVKASSHGDGIAVGYCCSSVLVSALSDGEDIQE